MNKKGNQKHLTLAQRIEIEKGLVEHKSFSCIAKEIGKDPPPSQRKSGFIPGQRKDQTQVILRLLVSTGKPVNLHVSVMKHAAPCVKSVTSQMGNVSMCVQTIRRLNATK